MLKTISKYEMVICTALCLFVQLYYLNHGHFIFTAGGSIRWFPLILALAPGLGAFLCIAVFARPLIALTITSLLLAAIHIANDKKSSLVGDPISWNDLHAINNIRIIGRYFDIWTGLFLLGAICILAACLLRLKFRCSPRKGRLLKLAGAVPLFLLSSASYMGATDGNFSEYISYMLKKYDAQYVYWDWKQNVMLNGLPQHVIQTSRREIPGIPSKEERDQFKQLASRSQAAIVRPRTIVFVVCEACWHDDTIFTSLFEPLGKAGYRHLRAISPVYGGTTVNASFEFLTGLPASNVLTGVIYQEYASLISDKAVTLPAYLKREGYRTVAVHNYYKNFWNRHIIKPKFGFDTFIGLEDMHDAEHAPIPSDKLVFDAAYEELQRYGNAPMFMFITTVSTHGPYTDKDDLGEGDYQQRLAKTLGQFKEFSDKVVRAYPDALIILAGDHKPGLTRYLYARNVFKHDDFERIGTRDDNFLFSNRLSLDYRGDVPIYIRHTDAKRLDTFIRQADTRPFYCFSKLLDDHYTATQLPAFNFSRGLCGDWAQLPLQEHRKQYPGWLYYLSLFEQ